MAFKGLRVLVAILEMVIKVKEKKQNNSKQAKHIADSKDGAGLSKGRPRARMFYMYSSTLTPHFFLIPHFNHAEWLEFSTILFTSFIVSVIHFFLGNRMVES